MSDWLRPARLLVVCTGNICRSPLAERLLVAGFAAAGTDDVEVSSAGTGALVGQPMTPETASLVAELGGADRPHAARQVTAELVRSADLVLALTRAHRSHLVRLAPDSLRRVLTLREVERLLRATPPDVLADLPSQPSDRVRELVPELLSRRGPVSDAQADDVIDPYRRSAKVYRRAAGEIAPAAAALVATVSGLVLVERRGQD